jgi:hypothetical protein
MRHSTRIIMNETVDVVLEESDDDLWLDEPEGQEGPGLSIGQYVLLALGSGAALIVAFGLIRYLMVHSYGP